MDSWTIEVSVEEFELLYGFSAINWTHFMFPEIS